MPIEVKQARSVAIAISTLGKPKLWVPMPDNSRLMDAILMFNCAAAMLSIVKPIGNLPIFIAYTAGERKLGLIGVLSAIALAVLFALLSSAFLQRLLGNIGMEVATRLLGLILTAIGIQFILNGLAKATLGLINPVIVSFSA